MPGKNNTTPIGDGSVGLNNGIVSQAGQMIDATISENNLRAAIDGGDKQYAGLLTAVQNMVSRWLPQDKLRILQEYGNVQGLPKNASGTELDKYVAITLISRLPKSEIQAIVKKQKADSAGLSAATRAAEGKAAMYAKKQTAAMTRQTEADMRNAAANMSDNKSMLKNMDMAAGGNGKVSKDKGAFYVDKYSAEALSGLRKELDKILSNYTDGYLANIIYTLGIENDEGRTSKDTLKKRVNNAINCYVALIIGKEKGIHASSFSPQAVDAIEKILLLTSFGWVTGKVGMTDIGINEKRKQAAKAKKEQTAYLKNIQARGKIKKNKKGEDFKKKKNNNAQIQADRLGIKTKQKSFDYSPLKEFTKGTLKKFFDDAVTKLQNVKTKQGDDAIRDIASSQGIIDADTADIDRLIVQIAQLMATEQDTMSHDMANALKEKDPEKRKQMADAMNDRMKSSLTSSISKVEQGVLGGPKQDYSDKIPIVSFNSSGDVASEGIMAAVPVILAGSTLRLAPIGSGGSGGYSFQTNKTSPFKTGRIMSAQDVIKVKDKKTTDEQTAEDNAKKIFGDALKQLADPSSKMKDKSLSQKAKKKYESNAFVDKDGKVLDYKDFVEKIIGVQLASGGMVPNAEKDTGGTIFMAGEKGPEIVAQSEKGTGVANIDQIADAVRIGFTNAYANIQNSASETVQTDKQANGTRVSAISKQISETGNRYFRRSRVDDRQIIPIMQVGKEADYIKNMFSKSEDIAEGIRAIATQTNLLPTYIMGLQQGGTAFNAAAAGATAGMVIQGVSEGMSAAADALTQKATGGSARAASSTSSLITGDPRRGTGNKANPELVNVDWSRRQVNVTPIPQMATGGTTKTQNDNSNLTASTRLTAGERNKPLSVGIGSGVVTYTKALQDVNDDSNKTAVKVYSINSGINEKISIGETEISLFEAVYGIYSSVASISSNSEIQRELLSTIASTTAAINVSTAKLATASNSNSGQSFQFPTELNSVLAGE